MAKGTKLSEYEKSEIIALKRVGKSQREILRVLGCSKTVNSNLQANLKYNLSLVDKKQKIT